MTNPTAQGQSDPTRMLPLGDQRPPTVRALLLAAALLAVAVFSGFVWWLIRHEPDPVTPAAGEPAATTPATSEGETSSPTEATTPSEVEAGRFTFTPQAPTDVTADCASVSYGKVQRWLAGNPCQRVSRGVYATTVGDVKALVSVVAVTMPGSGKAAELKGITDTSGTGNVSDMLRDGTLTLPGTPRVAGGNYASSVAGNKVTIIESAFYREHRDQALLDEITTQALEVATHLD